MILIVSSERDQTAGLVVDELARRSCRFTRFNTETFPQTAQITFTADSRGVSARIADGYGRLTDVSEVRSAYLRRPERPHIDPSVGDRIHRRFAQEEALALNRAVIRLIQCPWLNHPDAMTFAEHKPIQLKTAVKVGFPIPRTIITNDPKTVRDFAAASDASLIAKTLHSPVLSVDPPRLIYTTELSATDLDRLEDLTFAPCIIQQRVDKCLDVRVTVVGSSVLSASIESQDVTNAKIDWRRVDQTTIQYSRHNLPDSVARKCVAFVSELGLRFGAIDLALDEWGSYIFLECNPNGEWGWIEERTGLPISSAIADELIALSAT